MSSQTPRHAAEQPGAGEGVHVDDLEIAGLEQLARAASGGVEARALSAFASTVDAALLDGDDEVLDLVVLYERLAAWADAGAAAALAELVRRPERMHASRDRPQAMPLGSVAREFAEAEVAARLVCSPQAASSRVRTAVLLAGRLTATLAALRTGRIDHTRAAILAEETQDLPHHLAELVEAQVLGAAPNQTPARLRSRVRRRVMTADPGAARRRSIRAKAGRTVAVWATGDDMAVVQARLSADVAAQVWAAVQAAAQAVAAARPEGDRRTMDQLRADVFAAPFLTATSTGVLDGADRVRLGRHRGAPASVHVTVPASVLLGLSDEPGELAGLGPISADLAREIAGDATWRRVLTDPRSGTVLDVGTQTYRPPAGLARHVAARDGTCRAPACTRGGRGTDLDHTVPWPDGPTADDNLAMTCRHHHRLKQHRAVDVEQPEPGTLRWRYPTGHRYTVRPDRVFDSDPLTGDPLVDVWHLTHHESPAQQRPPPS